jgi:tetratricopeptide (TPR) repeat protein
VRLPEAGENNLWYAHNESETVFVFVHGILSDSRSAWLNEDVEDQGPVFWPHLVDSDSTFRRPSIFLGGYATELASGPFGIRDAARDFYRRLSTVIEPAGAPLLAKKRILFIAHSTGGIVVRHMLSRRAVEFADKIVGLMLVASPSIGSRDADRLEWLAKRVGNRMGTELQWNHPFLEELDKDFKTLVYKRFIPCLRGVEALENHLIFPRWLGLLRKEVIVEAESAGRYFAEPDRLPGTDHFSAVKPRRVDHPVHVLLRDFFMSDFDRPCESAQQVAEAKKALEERLRRTETERDRAPEDQQFLQAQRRAQIQAMSALVAQQGDPEGPPNLGRALAELADGKTATARDLLAQRAAKMETAGLESLQQAAESYRHLGALAYLDDTDAALAAYQRATELDPDDPDGWNRLGRLRHRIGDLENAEAALQAVLRLGIASGSPGWQAVGCGNLGNVYRTWERFDQAAEMYEKAFEIDQRLGRRSGMANAYGSLGDIHRIRGDLEQAVDMYEKALELSRELGSQEGVARSYDGLASVLLMLEDFDLAEGLYQESLRLFEELRDEQGLAATYGNLGIVYQARDDFPRAIEMHEMALALNKELGHKHGMATNHINLGLVHKLSGDLSSARGAWTRARDLYAEVGVPTKVQQMEERLADLAESR